MVTTSQSGISLKHRPCLCLTKWYNLKVSWSHQKYCIVDLTNQNNRNAAKDDWDPIIQKVKSNLKLFADGNAVKGHNCLYFTWNTLVMITFLWSTLDLQILYFELYKSKVIIIHNFWYLRHKCRYYTPTIGKFMF